MSDKHRFKPSGAQLICIAATLLAASSAFIGGKNDSFSEGTVKRDSYNGTGRTYSMLVEGISEKPEPLEFTVSERQYSESEITEKITSLAEEIPGQILHGNTDLENIEKDLLLPSSVNGYEGFRLSWRCEDSELILPGGKVNNQDLKAPVSSMLRLSVRYKGHEENIIFPVKVLPAGISEKEKLIRELKNAISNADKEQTAEESLKLPNEIEGHTLSYSKEPDRTPVHIILLGTAAYFILGLKPEQERRKAQKKRETALLLDYPEIISKLLVYTGAGLTIRNAWKKTASEGIRDCSPDLHPVYREMYRAYTDMEKGLPEGKAYMDFSRRCGLRCYTKLSSLLSRQYKNGDAGLSEVMEIEMEEAFEQRKNTARRLGEEASTKLTGPLILSLISIFLIILMPAIMAMN